MGGSHKIQNFTLLLATVAIIGLFFQNCGNNSSQISENNSFLPSKSETFVQASSNPEGDYTVCPSQGKFIEPTGKPNEFVAVDGAKYYCIVNHEPTGQLKVLVRFASGENVCSQFRVVALPNPDLGFEGFMSGKSNNVILSIKGPADRPLPAGVYIIKVEGLDNTCVGKISRFAISYQY